MNIEAYDADSLRKMVRMLEYENKILKDKLKKAGISYEEVNPFEEKIESAEEYDLDQGNRIVNPPYVQLDHAMFRKILCSICGTNEGGAVSRKKMGGGNMDLINKKFLQDISELLDSARKQAKTAVNLSMVYAYYEIGRRIYEEEQQGKERAEYGKYLLKELSDYLLEKYGKGFSVTNLKQMRKFYLTYMNDQIGQTVSDQFKNLPTVSSGRKFFLSWSHYLKLMRISDVNERHFYEIEAAKNDWSLSELKRQFNSALYERLVLSTNKDKVMRLATEGQVIEKPEDAVKDPYVLEFLGLLELPEYSETELETRIIDHLQKFLLELGTGFAYIGRQVRFTFNEEHFRVSA